MKSRYWFMTVLFILVLCGSAGRAPAAAAVPPPTGGEAMAATAAGSLPWVYERVDTNRLMARGDRGMAVDAVSGTHVVYGGDHLYYAHHDGVSWQIETVDGEWGTGSFASIALDTADHPHVIYFDRDDYALKYAYHDGTQWSVSTIDAWGWVAPEHVLASNSLALDSADLPHVSYRQMDQLHYASYDGSSWQIEIVATGLGPGAWPDGDNSLALDAFDSPHISFYRYYPTSQLEYAYRSGDEWHTEVVDDRDGPGSANCLALDAAGQPVVAYAGDWAAGNLYYATRTGGTWASEVLDDGGDVQGAVSLVMDDTDRPHIAYGAGVLLRYARYDGADWILEVVPSGTGQDLTLALGPTGLPVISDSDGTQLLDIRSDGSAWFAEQVDSGPAVGAYASLVLDTAGRPRIAYIGGGVRYAAHDGTVWTIETVDPDGLAGTSLQLDTAGRPHISYVGAAGLYYAFYDGSAWSIDLADPAAGYNFGSDKNRTSLALDSLGRPHIAYLTAYDLRHAYLDGSAWLTETVREAGGGLAMGGYPSLALDSADLPHVGYAMNFCGHYCFPRLVYAWNDGASWNEQVVDYVGGWYERMVLDATDRPHFAYRQGGGYPPVGSPMYAREEGGTWATWVVDASSFVNEGFNSVALDGAGRPHIAYRAVGMWDYGCALLRYASFDGAAWVTETVDVLTAAYPSLALDAQGYAHIAYYDSTYGDLLYAHQVCYPLEALSITGPISQPLGITALYTAAYTPLTATVPAFAWSSGFTGSVAPYSWPATGTYTLAVTATNSCSEATAGLTVTVFCQPLTGAAVRGPHSLVPGQEGTFWGVAQPITSSPPLTFTWDNGQVGPSTTYSWTLTGTYTLTVSATNVCGGSGTGTHTVQVLSEWPYAAYLPLLLRPGGR